MQGTIKGLIPAKSVEEMTMLQKLTLSWQFATTVGGKGNYQGTVPKQVKDARHRKNRAAKQARKVNRKNG